MSFAFVLLAVVLTAEERRTFEEAIGLHLASELEGALKGYGEILAAHPDFVPARLYRAEALWLLGRRDDAKAELSRAPTEFLLSRILGVAFGSGDSDSLATAVAAAYPLAEKKFLATGTPALVLLSQGDFDEAVADYRRIAELDPEDATLHRQLGSAFASAKLYLPTVEAFERVVAAAPKDASAWRQLGSGNLILQRWDPAIVALEKAIALSGESEGVLLALGYAYERKPDVAKALALYQRAVRFAPDSGRPHYRIGRALMAEGKIEEAERELTRASTLDPRMPEALGFLGEIQLRRGETEAALATLERAIGVDAEYLEAYYYLAQVYRRLGRGEDAQEALARYEELKRKKRGVLSQEEVLAIR